METPPQQAPYPQCVSLLVVDNDSRPRSSGKSVKLPGNYHIPQDCLAHYLASELDVTRLSDIFPYLWFAGRPDHVRPLHRQRLFQRSIIVTEQADLHLIWHNKQIYVKPLPPFLLCHDFFSRYICNTPLYADACGMLASYTKLVQHKSDYRVALELGLLPEDISWPQWTTFAIQVQPATVSKRYVYGELRLFRLNLIYRFCFGHWICGYHLLHTNFNSFFGSNFAWPLIIFAYLTTVLNAMQVVLASGRQNQSLDGWFYGASLAVVIVILGTLCAVAGFFVTLLLKNLVKALSSRERVKRDDLERQAKRA
ncbi:MAG: hypothetical protein Q9191_006314 [Dirinaria sp. TL-2023a]